MPVIYIQSRSRPRYSTKKFWIKKLFIQHTKPNIRPVITVTKPAKRSYYINNLLQRKWCLYFLSGPTNFILSDWPRQIFLSGSFSCYNKLLNCWKGIWEALFGSKWCLRDMRWLVTGWLIRGFPRRIWTDGQTDKLNQWIVRDPDRWLCMTWHGRWFRSGVVD